MPEPGARTPAKAAKCPWVGRGLLLVLLLTLGGGLFYKYKFERRLGSLLALKSIVEVERELGSPRYVYDFYPPQLGRQIITEDEVRQGYVVRIYLIRSAPPCFLAVKSKGDVVVASMIETS